MYFSLQLQVLFEFELKLKEYSHTKIENKRQFMTHKKEEHLHSVSECFEIENGWCRFDDTNCWFKHQKKTLCVACGLREIFNEIKAG